MPLDDPIAGCATEVKEPPKEPKKEKEVHYIEFKVVDDNGAPLKDVQLQVEIPGGQMQQVTTNDQGVARIDNIEPGSCKLLSNWKALQVKDTVLLQ